MISTETIKEIIISNEEFILNTVQEIVKRENILFPTSLHKVNIIFGVRRSGKTFLLYNLFKENKDHALYIDFEDERLKDVSASDLEKIKDCFLELKPHLLKDRRVTFLFDEIQSVDEWEKFARRVVEREGINLYVTGSSSKMMPLKIHTSLRGRAWSVEIHPFSFREFLKAKKIDLDQSVYGRSKVLVKTHLLEYLKRGGFPEVSLLKSDFEKTKVLKEYIDAMFFKDLLERFNITNIQLLETLKEGLFSSFSAKFSLTAFYKNYKDKFPFSKDSLFSYYKYFQESMLIFETRVFAGSVYKRLRNLPKIYLVDTGLARRVKTVDYGRLLENAVFLELRRGGFEIYHLEENGGCDFVSKREDIIKTIQVTWELGENNREREIQGLIRSCKALGVEEGLIITYDQEEIFDQDDIKIEILPFWKWVSRKDTMAIG